MQFISQSQHCMFSCLFADNTQERNNYKYLSVECAQLANLSFPELLDLFIIFMIYAQREL